MQNPSGSKTKGLRSSLRNLTSDFDQIGIATIRSSAIRGRKIRASSFSFANRSCNSRTSLVCSAGEAACLLRSRSESGRYGESVICRRPVRASLRGRPFVVRSPFVARRDAHGGTPVKVTTDALKENQPGDVRFYRILLPSAESMSSTASCAVWLAVSNTGLTSVNSTDNTRPEAAIFSIARWLSR